MGERLGTLGASSKGLDIGAAQRQLDSAGSGHPASLSILSPFEVEHLQAIPVGKRITSDQAWIILFLRAST